MLDAAVDASDSWGTAVDWQELCEEAARAALAHSPFRALLDKDVVAEISVRLGDDDEVQALNAQYRGKDKPTNVLSFPMVQQDLIETLDNSDDGEALLGDIILAHGVCAAEAAEKGVAIETHAAHLVVHGMLHLLGYDHGGDTEAEQMEQMEREALASIGIDDPYRVAEA